MTRRLGLAVAALALWVPAAAAQTIPADTVAWVGDSPVLESDYDHWDEVAAGAGLEDADARRHQVMQWLISMHWVRKEAADRGVRISRRAVLRAFRRQKRDAFPREADFRRFLSESHQTVADIKMRVRQDMLSDRLRERAVRGARTPRGQQRRLDRFVERFRRKWAARTVCGEGYETPECGSVVAIAPAG